MVKARVTLGLLIAAMAATACGGGGGSSPPVQNPTQAPNPSPSQEPTQSPSPAPTSTATPTVAPSATPTQAPTPTPTPAATPLVIHIGFELGEHTDPTFGPIWYYSTNKSQAQVITAMHGTKAQFINDDPNNIPHTASGLGSGPFPPTFDNSSGFTQSGSTIDGSLTWSSGTLNPGQKSQMFTIGPPGHYYFGCNYHYTIPPTQNNQSMGDVLVST